MENSMFLHASRLPDPPNQGSPQTTHPPPPPGSRLQFGPPGLRLFLLFIFSPVFSKCRRGLLASMERFGGRSVMVWVSFLWLFGSKWDLWKRVFYYSKTLLFEVWGGPGSWLFYIVFLHRYFYAIFFGIVRICWSSGCPWGSKCVTLLSLMPPSGSSNRGWNHFGAPIWPPRLPNGPKWCQKRPQSFQNVSETSKKTKKQHLNNYMHSDSTCLDFVHSM